MKKAAFFILFLMSVASVSGQTWSVDKAHSKLGFSITHLSVSSVEGSFKSFDAKITAPNEDFSDAVIELTADVNSINTDNEGRDKHLKTPEYFDAATYSTVTFKSTSFKKIADKKFKAIGNLTMHGVTKPVELEVTLNGTAVHPYTKKNIAGFKATGVIKRTDFGIAASTPSVALSDEVTITANAEFLKD